MKNVFKKYKFIFFVPFFNLFRKFRRKDKNYYGEYKTHKYYKYLDEIGKKIMDSVDNSKKLCIYLKNTPFCKSNSDYWGYVNFPHNKSLRIWNLYI